MTTTKINNEELESKVISFLRFPLIVGVVFIHAQFFVVPIDGNLIDIENFSISHKTMRILSQGICDLCVPLFFAISGFLYFRIKDFNFFNYLNKTKGRIKTLVIPYLFWNTSIIFFFYLAYLLSPDMMSGMNKPIIEYSWQDWLWAYWNKDKINGFVEGGAPLALQFWFIRDLFIISLFSPLIYILIKRIGVWTILLLFSINILDFIPKIPGFDIQAWVFFSLGAYFSINKRTFLSSSTYLIKICAFLYILSFIIYFIKEDIFESFYLWYLNILSGMVLLVNIVAWGILTYKWFLPKFIVKSSFFIFAYHAIPCLALTRLSFKLFNPSNDLGLLCVYLICPIITILSGLIVYYALTKYLPRFTAIITGGR